jgi:hypothetical protein
VKGPATHATPTHLGSADGSSLFLTVTSPSVATTAFAADLTSARRPETPLPAQSLQLGDGAWIVVGWEAESAAVDGWLCHGGLGSIGMAAIVLRVRLISGDHLDVVYEESDANEEDVVLQHAIETLQSDTGLLRCTHGDRLLLLYGRGVAALEVAPLGAVL